MSAILAKMHALVLDNYRIVYAGYEPGQTVYSKDTIVAMAVVIDGGLITPILKVSSNVGLSWTFF